MTEREAREILDEIRTVRPRKRVGCTTFELRPDGRLDVYTMNKALTRMWFSHTSNPSIDWMHPDVRAWVISRGVEFCDQPRPPAFCLVCAWCRTVMRQGDPHAPTSHGMCPTCSDQQFEAPAAGDRDELPPRPPAAPIRETHC